MRRIDEPERQDVEKGESKTERILLEKLGRFGAYTTPELKALLSYGEGKLRVAAASI
jgi:hypothetical protein